MTKKRSSEILERIEGNFSRFLSQNKFPQNFCPPNIYDKSTPVSDKRKIITKYDSYKCRVNRILRKVTKLLKQPQYL